MLPLELYHSIESAWCPGCGNFPMLKAFKQALAEMEIRPEDILVVSGIGQAAKFPHYLRCNTFNGIHGRTLPVATGVRLANPDLKVVVTTGDGDCYGEGAITCWRRFAATPT
jgi:2-oxoglutarate/2-oxoacid ferredoxin oxidoreductase subunit beta